MAARSMSGQGLAELFSWVVWHGSSTQEKVELQQELLRLAKQVAALLVREDRGFPAWCKAAASVLGFQAGLPAGCVDKVQEVTAQQLFWLLFVIAANNRPPMSAACRSSSSSSRPLPAQIQDCFLDTVASLAGQCKPTAGSRTSSSIGSSNIAFCLLPECLRLCMLKLLAGRCTEWGGQSSSHRERSSQHGKLHGLLFDEVALELTDMQHPAARCHGWCCIAARLAAALRIGLVSSKQSWWMSRHSSSSSSSTGVRQPGCNQLVFSRAASTEVRASRAGVAVVAAMAAAAAPSHTADGVTATPAAQPVQLTAAAAAAAAAANGEQQQRLRSSESMRQRPGADE
ncbi:hypothetical protein COO60DRAFT_91598 [Scenedesmus sp. NREL 46B-D3]|nr:hypothetical protein COO60DRAFT_91598 [Scenedesmus sp. NREL 46B-D3]